MLRRLLAASFIVVAVAACGGSTPTESPSASGAPASVPSIAPSPSPSPSESPTPSPALPAIRVAACNAIALRANSTLSGKLLDRVSSGTKVRVVAEVTGDAYTVGACGSDGNTWLKINRVGGKKVKTLYGTPYVYAAAGLFQ